MILAFHPTRPEMPGDALPVLAEWRHHLSPWSDAIFRQNDFGSILIQELVTGEFAIYIWRLEVNSAVRLYPSAGMPTIALHFTLEGDIPCKLGGFGDKLLEQGGQEMFYVPIGCHEAWFEPGTYESLHIELKLHYLEELVGIRPEIKELISRLHDSSSSGLPMAAASIHYTTRAILENLKSCHKEGPLLRLEMHKYILELLCEYLGAIQQEEEDRKRKNISHKDLMIRIKNHILSAPDVHEHTLEKLAKLFGANETLIKRGFKSLYNISVTEFVRYYVMTKSHFLLTTTKKSIDDIAEEVGYSWRPAFEGAFKKYFDYSPTDLRYDRNSYKLKA